jgi:hypothetical protein
VHQPLHATPVATRAGCDSRSRWRGKGATCTRLWDVLVSTRAERDGVDEAGYLRAAAAAAAAADPTRAPTGRRWTGRRRAAASCATARLSARTCSATTTCDAHRAQMDMQLRLRGARLADMLNSHSIPRGSAR